MSHPPTTQLRRSGYQRRAKLTKHDVRDLRAWWAEVAGTLLMSEFCRLASAQWTKAGYPIAPCTIRDAVTRTTWAHVP